MSRGFSIPRIGHQIEKQVASGIARSRIISRAAGISRVTQELETIGIELAPAQSLTHEVRGDLYRAQRYANNYARQWVQKAEGETVAAATREANKATLSGLTRTAVTESSQAFGDGRAKALDGLPVYEGRPDGGAAHKSRSLLKVWDAQLDKRTCSICSAADGTIVGLKENFPYGAPGAVHPWCRCSWQALSFDEQGDQGYIEPKAPAKVISLPTGAKSTATTAKPVSGEKLPAVPGSQPRLARKVGRLADALETGSQADQRAALRGIVKDAFPSATSKDVTLKGKLRAKAHVLDTNNYLREATGADALHGFDGAITVDKAVFDRAKVAARKLSQLKPGEVVSMQDTDSLRVLIHEELHGHSRATLASYKGPGLVLEEVGTELNARAAVSKLYPGAEFSGSYQEWIDQVVNIVQGAADDAERAVSVARVRAAHAKVIAPGPRFASEHDALEAFVSGLDLTPEAQQYAKDSLFRTFEHIK